MFVCVNLNRTFATPAFGHLRTSPRGVGGGGGEGLGLIVVSIWGRRCQVLIGSLVLDEGAHGAAVRGQIGFSSH